MGTFWSSKILIVNHK